MSGMPRIPPTVFHTLAWYDGLGNHAESPPPLAIPSGALFMPRSLATATLQVSFHTVSGESRSPLPSRDSRVPPTAVTSGSLAGNCAFGDVNHDVLALFVGLVAPLSPAEASTVMCSCLASANALTRFWIP